MHTVNVEIFVVTVLRGLNFLGSELYPNISFIGYAYLINVLSSKLDCPNVYVWCRVRISFRALVNKLLLREVLQRRAVVIQL